MKAFPFPTRLPLRNLFIYSAGRTRFALALLALLAGLRVNRLQANPAGLTVGAGRASVQSVGAQLNVTVSQTAVLNWQSFNISAGETTAFFQPSANSIVLNVIGGANPSQIFGSLKANGTVILENAGGFYFGPDSMVKVGGSFIATTAPPPADFGSGAAWQFNGLPPLAAVVNYGRIEAGAGKSLFLIAEDIENHGTLAAPGGNVDLAAGQSVLVSESPDGRGLSAAVSLPAGSVGNFGQIIADGGSIVMQAKVVNQNGLLHADSIRNQNGVIELVASDQLNLGADSQIVARGDDSAGGSTGGDVTLKSGDTFSDLPGSGISIRGGSAGGNGGQAEISAENLGEIYSAVDGAAQAGFTGGQLLVDPNNLTLTSSSLSTYSGLSQIVLEGDSITVAANAVLNPSSATHVQSGNLILEALGDITFGNKAEILDANGWNVSLYAGVTAFSAAGPPSVNAGTGNIYLNGGAGSALSGAIQTSQGSISLEAGNSIFVGRGYVATTGGGAIFADALSGDISTGTTQVGLNNTGYSFNTGNNTYTPGTVASGKTTYGGIGTFDGGDLTLIAGGSINPSASSATAVAGAFGSAPGDVTLAANKQISGTFNVADGTGTMLAGVSVSNGKVSILNAAGNIGTSVSPVTLGLIGGADGASWNLFAANNLYLQEVRNPNGSANANAQNTPGVFDYAGNAAANLWAGNALQLGSASTALSGNGAKSGEAVYCPTLELTSGTGGITIYNSIVLFPSSQGGLKITDGGDLSMLGSGAAAPALTMADSLAPTYSNFGGAGHLHAGDSNPVQVDVAGNVYGLNLSVPAFANIVIGGNAYNLGFTGQNVSSSGAAGATSITVLGDLLYPDALHAPGVSLADPLPASLLGSSALAGNLGSGVTISDANAGLSINGPMSLNALNYLLAPAQALDPAQRAAVLALYAESGSANFLALSGPGSFTVSARNIDLGISAGMVVDFPDAVSAASSAISPNGANLAVNTTGNLEMTVSAIANAGLADGGTAGGIKVRVGGTLDVGGENTALGDPNSPKGIFTTGGGAIDILAAGNVNVDGSRIAAYDGGNISVESSGGDVNAGAGGQGSVVFQSLQLDSATSLLEAFESKIPFSGILATTVFGSDAALGNITISTPNGSVNSSLGGILQIAFNSADTSANSITINSGKEITATGSGVIGYNLNLKAVGDITGVLFGSRSVTATSQQNVDVTAVSGGNVNITASDSVSGTVIGGGDVNVSGSSIDAAVRGGSVSTSGDTAGATFGVPTGPANNTVETADTANSVAAKTQSDTDDDEQKKKKPISLAQKASRVTVILPKQH